MEKIDPAAATPLAVSASPFSCANPWAADGAWIIGVSNSIPKTDVCKSAESIPRNIRGMIFFVLKEVVFSFIVHSSSEPPRI